MWAIGGGADVVVLPQSVEVREAVVIAGDCLAVEDD
jgi:hypothetical protein